MILAETVGKENCLMAYAAVANGMVIVHGIPEECRPLKTPGTYGLPKLKAILAAARAIRVELFDGAHSAQTSTSSAASGSLATCSVSAIELMPVSLPSTSTTNFVKTNTVAACASSPNVPPQTDPLLSTLLDLLKSVVANPSTTPMFPVKATVGQEDVSSIIANPMEMDPEMMNTGLHEAVGNDTTPCCVCRRQHNQPPFQEWFVCIPCGGWHHKSCGAG
jgi:hypothetical protein